LGEAAQGSIGSADGTADEGKRKGRSYGTIIVDLERHRVVDLLPDRTAATLADWLRQRPGIAVVARDRSTGMRAALRAGRPPRFRWPTGGV
jgi:transposase